MAEIPRPWLRSSRARANCSQVNVGFLPRYFVPSSFTRAWAIPAFCDSFVTSAWDCAIAAMNAIRLSRIRLLHRISGCPVKRHPVDDSLNPYPTANEFADSVGHVLVIPSEAVDPAHHQRVASRRISKSRRPSGRSQRRVETPDTPWSDSTRSGLNPFW
jgi:hypothetical protein